MVKNKKKDILEEYIQKMLYICGEIDNNQPTMIEKAMRIPHKYIAQTILISYLCDCHSMFYTNSNTNKA